MNWSIEPGEFPYIDKITHPVKTCYTETNQKRNWSIGNEKTPYLYDVLSHTEFFYTEENKKRLWYIENKGYPKLYGVESPPEYNKKDLISYREAIDSGQRGTWDAEVYIDGETISKENIVHITMNEILFDGGSFNVGTAASSYVEIQLLKEGRIFKNKLISFKIGFHAENVEQTDFRFGNFFVTDVQHDEGSKTQTITAYDAMYFLAQNAAVSKTIENAAKFYDPQTLMDIITNFTGIELEDENCLLWTANLMLDNNGKRISNGKNVSISLKYEEIKDLTVRDIIAKIALLTGTNAIFNRNNKLEFLSLKNRYAPKNQNVIYTEYDPYIGEWKPYEKIVSDEIEIDAKKRYYTFSKDDTDSQIVEGFVEYGNYTASTRQIASYPYGTGVIDLTFTISDTSIGNTDAATEIMKSFYYHNMEQLHDYMPGSVSFIGDPSLRVGDIVSVIDLDGKNHKFPIMQNTIEYDGGVKNTCYAYGKGDSDSDSYYTESSSGSTVSSINSAPYTPPDIQKINEKISSIEKEIENINPGDTVSIATHQTNGTKIATFTVSGTSYDVYAPSSPTAAQIQQWTAAAEKAHTHSNKAVLDATTAAYTVEEKEKLAGIEANANNYTHPTYASHFHGFYKFTNDGYGHITGTTAVTKNDIIGLGIPGENTDTKNTAGATNSWDKLFLIGAKTQEENPKTYSRMGVYIGSDISLNVGGAALYTHAVNFCIEDGEWAKGITYHSEKNNSINSLIGTFGAYGESDVLKYYYFGSSYNNYTVRIDADGKITAKSFSGANATQSTQGLMSAADKKKLDGIAEGANKITVDTSLSSTSTNPVQNKAVKAALDGKAASSHGTHVTYATTAPKAAGTASSGSAANVSRGDHVHPAQTSVSGNAGTATKLQTARTITLSQGLQGSVSFDGSANVTLNGSLKQCSQVDETADFSSYPWHKIADVTLTAAYTDTSITFLVSKMWNTVPNSTGILTAHIRTSSTKVFESGQLRWLVAGSDINPSDFVLVYTNTASTSVKAELWYKQNTRYDGWSFTVLKEHSRTAYSNIWKLYSSAGHGSASRTSGTGEIVSSIIILKNPVKSLEDSGWKSCTLGSFTESGTVKYRTFGKQITIYGESVKLKSQVNTSANAPQSLATCSVDFTNIKSVYGIGKFGSHTAVISLEKYHDDNVICIFGSGAAIPSGTTGYFSITGFID